MRRLFTYTLLLIIVVFGMSFATLNSESVTIDYYLSQSSLPLSLLLVIVFAMGCLVGLISSAWLLIKSKVLNYRLRQQLESAEKSIEQYRLSPSRKSSS